MMRRHQLEKFTIQLVADDLNNDGDDSETDDTQDYQPDVISISHSEQSLREGTYNSHPQKGSFFFS